MFISSDTNIWIDFSIIACIDKPFLLDNLYYLSDIIYHDEIDENTGFNHSANKNHYQEIRDCVKENKLHITTTSPEELKLAMKYASEYRPPIIKKAISLEDGIALAIAKKRKWVLLSGDSGLREAAKLEGVICHGTLWICNELFKNMHISKDEYLTILESFLSAAENKKRFLPKEEIIRRITKLQ